MNRLQAAILHSGVIAQKVNECGRDWLVIGCYSGQVQSGIYKPDLGKEHSHIGRIHNLCLDNVKDKFPN